jgi:hypothetical protein
MWTAIFSFLGGPVVKLALESYKAKLQASGETQNRVEHIALREMELDSREAELNNDYRKSLIGRWYEPVNMLGYIFVFHFGKVVVWDNALQLGSTPDLGGNTAKYAGMVAAFYLGKRTVDSTGALIANAIRAFKAK